MNIEGVDKTKLLESYEPTISIGPEERTKGTSTISKTLLIVDNKYDKRREIIVPVVFAIVIKSLQNLNLAESTINVSFTLILRILFKGAPDSVVEFVRERLALRLNEEPQDMHEGSEMTFEEKSRILRITWRKTTDITFNSKYHQFPFDEHDVKMKVELTSPYYEAEKTNIRFTVLSIDHRDTLMSFKTEADLLPEFNIATNTSYVKFPAPERKEYKGGEGFTLQYKPVIEYYVHLYRQPGYVVLSTAAPMFLISLATIACLAFSATAYSDKMSIIVTLMLALFAFMPSVRTFIPKVPYLTQLEMQIYFVLGVMLLVLGEAIATYFLSLNTTNTTLTDTITKVVFGIVVMITLIQTTYFIAKLLIMRSIVKSYIPPKKYKETKISGSGGAFDLSLWKVEDKLVEVHFKPPEPTVAGYQQIK